MDAVNKGFARCKGDFIGLNFSDDILSPDGISRKVALFQNQREIDFIYGDCEDIDENGAHLFVRYGNNSPYREWVRTCQMPITLQSSLWRRSVIDRVGGFKTSMNVAADWEFFLRVGVMCQIKYLPGVTGKFRAHPNSQSQNLQLLWVSLVPKMYEEFFARNDLPQEIKAVQKQSLANAHVYSAYLLMTYSSLNETVKEVIRAIGIYPQIIFSRRFVILLLLCVMGSTLRRSFRRIRTGSKADGRTR
ncbi:MAG: hypothetical protein IMZ61_02880 [Planctomycetes bacterium]|nr:hypothetical protein [Planctomycetota bacterium]